MRQIPEAQPAGQPVRLLCVDSSAADFESVSRALSRAMPDRHLEFLRVADVEGLQAALATLPSVVLCDCHLPCLPPEKLLEILAVSPLPAPVVLVTHPVDDERATRLLRAGARAYVTKDRLGILAPVVERALMDQDQTVERDLLCAQLDSTYRRLKLQSARLVAAQVREREQLSHVLHDDLAQTLAGMVMHLHAARGSNEPVRVLAHTDTAISMAKGAIDRLKAMSFSLRPAQLDLLGLVPTLDTLLDMEAAEAGLKTIITARGTEPPGLGDKAAVAVRLVQQAIDNLTRHGNARRVWIRVHFMGDARLGLTIADDDASCGHARQVGDPGHGNLFTGLNGLADLADLAGGRLKFRVRPGSGVVVRAML